MNNMSIGGQEQLMKKTLNLLDSRLKIVYRKDDLDPMCDDDDCPRAEMSCGHAVSPDSLTQWCRSQLDEGIYMFRCGALVTGAELCNKPWSYLEVRRVACLTHEERRYFESTIARLAAMEYCEIQPCPQCKSSVERLDLANLCVRCTICKADGKKTFEFCWQCLQEWKGPGPRSDRCDNDGCTNTTLKLLQICKTISLPDVKGVTCCPSVRACPTCGMKVEHNREKCKGLFCTRCRVEFCFVCLKGKWECCNTSSPYTMCSSGVAPRQTSIPVWRK